MGNFIPPAEKQPDVSLDATVPTEAVAESNVTSVVKPRRTVTVGGDAINRPPANKAKGGDAGASRRVTFSSVENDTEGNGKPQDSLQNVARGTESSSVIGRPDIDDDEVDDDADGLVHEYQGMGYGEDYAYEEYDNAEVDFF